MRKQSEKTKLRYAKAKLKALSSYQNALVHELIERRSAGLMLANIAFNLCQRTDLSDDTRKTLRECQMAWDGIKRGPLP